MSKVYFGYDESNNGNIPEFHILTFTNNVETVRKPLFKLFKGKEKKEVPTNLSDELKSKNITFRFLILFKEDLIRINKFMEENKISNKDRLKFKKVLVLYSFFSEIKLKNSIFDIFLDGCIGNSNQTKKTINFLKNNFSQISCIRTLRAGDKRLEIINLADRIAYQFFKEYSLMGMHQFGRNQKSLPNIFYSKRIFSKFDNNLLEFIKLN